MEYGYVILLILYGGVIGVKLYLLFSGNRIALVTSQLIMGSAIFLGAIGVVLYTYSFRLNVLDYESPIEYSNNENITFENFRGLNRPGHDLHGKAEFAFICSSIEVEDSELGPIARTYFHPSRSYVFKANLYDKYLLSHEIYHLKITELHARIFNKHLSKNLYESPNALLERVEEMEREMQFEYDDDSYHGSIMKKQVEWQNKVDSLLNLHKPFDL